MPDKDTLLAYLVPRLTGCVEDAATDALSYILNRSESCRSGLADLVSDDDFRVAPLAYTETQVSPSKTARLDLVAYESGRQRRLIIESKFWAGLSDGQASGYVDYLADEGPAVLLFVAPESRTETLWSEICQQFESKAALEQLEPADPVRLPRCAKVDGGQKRVALTSWNRLLAYLRDAATEKTSAAEIEQLAGLAMKQDDSAFLPLHADELEATLPRRMHDYQRIVSDIYWAHGKPGAWMDGDRLSVTNSSNGHGRYFRFPKMLEAQWIGISYAQWASYGKTPIWLQIWDSVPVDLHALCEQLEQLNLSVEWTPGKSLWIPILLKTGVTYDVVLEDAVQQMKHVRDAIRACAAESEAEPG